MGNRRSAVGMLAMVALLAGASACTGSSEAGTNGKDGTKAPDAQVRITPANGTGAARPDQGVAVASSGGKLEQVTVTQGGAPVPGDFTADHMQWKTKWTLKPGASYSVNVTAKNAKGKTTTTQSTFTTQKATQSFKIADITPMPGEKVGVGMPIIVKFDTPIANKANVERALEVKSDKGDTGVWHWMSPTEVVFRTQKFWGAHQNVTFTAHLAGVRGLKGVYGKADVSQSFKIGASNVTVANAKTHYMKVNHDGVVKTFPISTGMGTTTEYTTTSGLHITQEKSESVTMESPGRKPGDAGYYKEVVHLAVRITNRGEYVHQSVGEYDALGHRNASHGCVRTSPTGARYFYDIAQRGDIVNVTGTSRKLANEVDSNGWVFWALPWNKWVAGSALA
ncbi:MULTISPECIES: L,D-transpeptidase [Actinoallomurus]|uniref:L,D-transpeptidase n=1 Tax=Actinoallomurus TaxID=667113 RepID=UPI002090902A|nr:MULTISPECIES: Ig-like domain-containing protein [Actinoallomurus]MCO5968023.1 Ig-like domain-containing protein [Actinoallomurus soli]MCO5994524.1 Ig-like domain-containing protein [Actinoallomurus rhizosphaericola]